ncbi:hypothetical protein EJP82_01105 [Paenibacillus anaericanus]|uniref:Uncharacterized protein n=1 Tax=Paenibacillus anaericanus TaxID=170367 RepID=A0A433YFC1_9BACL|nr:hypothetical protein [Paenibacillus anaericanus]RUT48570.1 hypothetical protein EJP82_01105 [Paenibacillus anaericanus]
MEQQAVCLTDDQVATVVQRGGTTTLTILETECYDSEHGIYIPAKSISVSGKEGLLRLRSALNALDLEN